MLKTKHRKRKINTYVVKALLFFSTLIFVGFYVINPYKVPWDDFAEGRCSICFKSYKTVAASVTAQWLEIVPSDKKSYY